jgi:hypothetical protein
MSSNQAASVRARLKNRADATGKDYNLLLTQFALERLLYRLSVSPHADGFLLKGALLFVLWHELPGRPTRDLDLLGFGSDDVAAVVARFRDVCVVACDDGVRFDAGSVTASEIRSDSGYGGVRVRLLGELGGARLSLQVDVGFGDAVTPEPLTVSYPVLLEDLPAPRLRAYPKATVVAEKFEAICVLGMANSRLKDYFDLWVLLQHGNLEPVLLARALVATCNRRGTTLPVDWPAGLTDRFAADPDKQTQWRAFLRRNLLDAPELPVVISGLREGLSQPLELARKGVL